MPEIVFKGQVSAYKHHLRAPYRPCGHTRHPWHGDKLAALKSPLPRCLLPRHAGQIDLIFIDPPGNTGNTGNTGGCYSDGVNSPIMRGCRNTHPWPAKTCCATTSGCA